MIEQLSELVASQRAFIAHAAHELRSPLTAILGQIQLSLRRPRANEEYQQALTLNPKNSEAKKALDGLRG